MRIGAVARIHSALAVRFQEFEIAFDGSSHRQWPCNAIGRPRTEHHARASPVLRLRETEDDRPVGITKVVCDADLLHYVAPAADVMACDPCSCDSGPSLAAFQPAVADMQARLEQPVVWLAPAGETTSALSALEPCIGGSARHRSCPTNVQYTGKNTPRQACTDMGISPAHSRPSETRRDIYGHFCVSLTAKTGDDFSSLAPKRSPV